MWLDALLLAVGLALIVKGGDWFVGASVRLAEQLRMPRVVVGTTLVSLATTTPELTVSIMAGLKGESGLAVGNAVGSCICNIGLILGVSAVLKEVVVNPRTLSTPLIAMFLAGLLLIVMTGDLVLQRWQGAVLLALGIGYFAWDFAQHYRDTRLEAVEAATAVEEDHTARFPWLLTRQGTVAQFLGGAAVVVLGSRLLVGGAVGLAGAMGIPPIVIGLTVVAVGTSLPELITAVASARKDVSDLSVGNVLGANIANLTLIVGAAAILTEVRIDRPTQVFNFPALLVSMILFLYVVLIGSRVTRKEGWFLLAAYAVYLAGVVGMTLLQRG